MELKMKNNMVSKLWILVIILFQLTISVSAQQWDGSTTTRDLIYRDGNVGIGFDLDDQQIITEKLEINGAIKLGTTSNTTNGIFRFTQSDFEGRVGNTWKSMTSKWNISGNNIINTNTGYVQLGSTSSLGIGRAPNSKLEIYSIDPGTSWATGLQLTAHYSGDTPSDPTTYMVQRDNGFYIRSDGGYNFMNSLGTLNFFHINTDGKVGIGTTSPTSKLELNGGIFINSDAAANDMFKIAAVSTENIPAIKIGIRNNTVGNLTIGRWKLPDEPESMGYVEDRIVLDADNVSYIINTPGLAIGKTTIISGFLLDVDGKIRANEIVVNTVGADFVFEDNYNLKTLNEVESFIKENKHLPDIPTAKEVEENGVSLGEMQTKLLQKIEELTLYVIEQNKSIEELKQENTNLKELLINKKIVE